MKKVFLYIIAFVLLCIVVFFFVTGNHSEATSLTEKVKSEIEYISSNLVLICNNFNDITYQNYEVKTKSEEISGEGSASGNGEHVSAEEGQSSSSGGEPAGSAGTVGSAAGPSSSSEGSASNQGQSQHIISSTMEQNSILSKDKKYEPKWQDISFQVEQLYSTWNTMVVDLHKLNINSNNILAFTDILNEITIDVKNKKKENALLNLSKIYNLLPKYMEEIAKESKDINMIKIEANIINSYVNTTIEKWDDAKRNLQDASSLFANLLNTVSEDTENKQSQIGMERSYILINELLKSTELKDKEIYFINYKNLMKQMDNSK